MSSKNAKHVKNEVVEDSNDDKSEYEVDERRNMGTKGVLTGKGGDEVTEGKGNEMVSLSTFFGVGVGFF
ncbi:hypothetical protein L6452_44245 [Arctium lappa]|uniref:Uncharacterized protein n=1 Tax=Arctium lappa TaxID=4217 RepID=A0ACB8XFC5_ARCLA|nr:hypothetical protein L6452_44245 [Arctium lappa]